MTEKEWETDWVQIRFILLSGETNVKPIIVYIVYVSIRFRVQTKCTSVKFQLFKMTETNF